MDLMVCAAMLVAGMVMGAGITAVILMREIWALRDTANEYQKKYERFLEKQCENSLDLSYFEDNDSLFSPF